MRMKLPELDENFTNLYGGWSMAGVYRVAHVGTLWIVAMLILKKTT